MISKTFENEFLKNLSLLNKEQQNKVLVYIKSLLSRTKQPNRDLLQLAGSIDPQDLRQMSEAIEAGCENIDKNEW